MEGERVNTPPTELMILIPPPICCNLREWGRGRYIKAMLFGDIRVKVIEFAPRDKGWTTGKARAIYVGHNPARIAMQQASCTWGDDTAVSLSLKKVGLSELLWM